jgi:hypothetical protein
MMFQVASYTHIDIDQTVGSKAIYEMIEEAEARMNRGVSNSIQIYS